jgi:hypothetical protein
VNKGTQNLYKSKWKKKIDQTWPHSHHLLDPKKI